MANPNVLNEVIALDRGLLVTVTHYIVGRNGDSESNGIYVRLCCEWLPMTVMSIYQNEFKLLPKEWQPMVDDALATGTKMKPKKSTVTDMEDAFDRDIAKPLPIPAEIARYAYNRESEKASDRRWRFRGVYRFLPHLIKKEEELSTDFKSVQDCIDWAMAKKAFDDRTVAKNTYDAVRDQKKPQNAPQMYAAWVEHVNFILKEHKKT